MAGKMKFGAGSGGLTSLLKEGYKHFGGLEEAVLKNIEACKGLAAITRTSLGPNGELPFADGAILCCKRRGWLC